MKRLPLPLTAICCLAPTAFCSTPPANNPPFQLVYLTQTVTMGQMGVGMTGTAPDYFYWTDWSDFEFSYSTSTQPIGAIYNPVPASGTLCEWVNAENDANGNSPTSDIEYDDFPYFFTSVIFLPGR